MFKPGISQLVFYVSHADNLMRSAAILVALLCFVCDPVYAFGNGSAEAQTASQNDRGWTRLFDGKSLHGWYTQIQNKKKNEDPAKFFQVEDGVIHVYKDQPAGTAVPNGYIATEAVYANYHLRMEYKWGSEEIQAADDGGSRCGPALPCDAAGYGLAAMCGMSDSRRGRGRLLYGPRRAGGYEC